MTEKIILSSLLDWIKNNYPDYFLYFNKEKNPEKKKEIAKKLLLLRLKFQPDWIYVLPESLLIKLGLKNVFDSEYIPDLKEKNLINTLGNVKIVGAFKNNSSLNNYGGNAA